MILAVLTSMWYVLIIIVACGFGAILPRWAKAGLVYVFT